MFLVTNFGASAPGIKTPPIKRSQFLTSFFKSASSLKIGLILSPNISDNSLSLFDDLSTIKTLALMPVAIKAAFSPTTPPPKITTLAEATPGAPPKSKPLPF